MKILTIGASPYLLVRNGKINAGILKRLVQDGHAVSSAVWHHDEGYFMPSDEGVHAYADGGKHICFLYPFTPKTDEASPYIYELMKAVQPDLVITIGDHKDTNFIYAIKAMYPTLFKWLAIYTIDCNGIPSINKDAFEYADQVITTNEFSLKEISSFANANAKFVPYGPNHQIFNYENKEKAGVLCSARNAQASNLSAFVMAVAERPFNSYLHTNLYDPGDYNIDILKQKYKAVNLSYTEDYCSVKDGIPDFKLAEIYNKSAIIVDCSIKSATALSLLEGMACGCIPVGPSYGRVGEIISEMPEGLRFTVPYNIFIGQNEEEFAIVSSNELSVLLSQIMSNKTLLQQASEAAIEVASRYSEKAFLDSLSKMVEEVRFTKQILALDVV